MPAQPWFRDSLLVWVATSELAMVVAVEEPAGKAALTVHGAWVASAMLPGFLVRNLLEVL